MIQIENLTKNYNRHGALRGINLQVAKGELFAYLGPNGAGKTTTIRILTGLTRLTSGKVLLGGHDILSEPLAAKRQCGLVPQQLNLDGDLTILENLVVHGRLHHMPRAVMQERIERLLDYIELSEKRHMSVKHLSGGMKRRAMIARALLHQPGILFLDEPTVGLDANIRRQLWGLIKKNQQDGVTIFLTTHYIEEAEFLAERVAFIDQGQIVALDTPQNLMSGLGGWAMDQLTRDALQTHYFATQQEAKQFAVGQKNSFTIRRVNLEDAFLKMTGKKVI